MDTFECMQQRGVDEIGDDLSKRTRITIDFNIDRDVDFDFVPALRTLPAVVATISRQVLFKLCVRRCALARSTATCLKLSIKSAAFCNPRMINDEAD